MKLNKQEIDTIMFKVIRALKIVDDGSLIKVILYGSCARGDNEQFSDVDIMCLVDGEISAQKYNRIFIEDIGQIANEFCVLIPCHFVSQERYNTYMECTSYFKNIEKEGICYYDKPTKG